MSIFSLFNKKKTTIKIPSDKNFVKIGNEKEKNESVAKRKGELGEYKIDIQLAQLPSEYKYITDIIIENPNAKSGYSQIDHIVISPYGIFVIETKNYQGTIYVNKEKNTWSVNGKFQMMNPFYQNYGHIQALKRLIEKKYYNLFISIVSFTKRCTFKNGLEFRHISSNDLLVYDIELSEYIHRKVSVLKLQNKHPLLSEEDIINIFNIFTDSNNTDPTIREQHVEILKQTSNKQQISDAATNNTTNTTTQTCVICNKKVSEKVSLYCLSNKKFNGKIYCYEHQRNI